MKAALKTLLGCQNTMKLHEAVNIFIGQKTQFFMYSASYVELEFYC